MNGDLETFFQQSPYPWWIWNTRENIVSASRLKVEMIGYDQKDFKNRGYDAYTDLLHPEDYQRTMDAMRDLLTGRSSIYQVDYRIRAASGEYHWYMDRGVIQSYQEDGAPLEIRGIVLDLGVHIKDERSEEELIALLRSAVPSRDISHSLVAVCSNCRKIRSGDSFIEVSDAYTEFIGHPKTHTICPDCLQKLYPEYAQEILRASVS